MSKPKLNIPQPSGVASPLSAPAPSGLNVPKPSGASAPEPSEGPLSTVDTPPPSEPGSYEPDHGHAGHHGAARPIEYFYGPQLGDSASVSTLLSLAIGVLLSAGWLGIIFLTKGEGNYLSELFLERSWVQFATTLLAGWTIGILVLKVVHIQKQRRALMLDALPETISPEINMYNVADFYDHVLQLPRKLHNTFMWKRIRKGLEYFYVRENNSEVASMMSSQSDIDANAIAGSYSLAKVFLWAIPIMGFIGTVLGIGAAIGDFADALQSSGEAAAGAAAAAGGGEDAMMAGLRDVLGGLGTAFDTTFLALVFSILLMIPASSLQAAEEGMLNMVDEYSNDNLIKRLNDGGGGGAITDAAALKSLGDAIAASNSEVATKFAEIHSGARESYQKVIEGVNQQLEVMAKRSDEFGSKVNTDLYSQIDKLAEGINNLNNVLKDLDGKQVVVKKKLWPF